MDTGEKISSQPRFEIKYINENNCKKILEKEFLLNLNKGYARISPIIKRMLNGEEIAIFSGIYGIKTRYN